MDRKLPLGVKIIGICEIILGLGFINGLTGDLVGGRYTTALFVLPFISYIGIGIGIMRLSNTARNATIILNLISLVALLFLFFLIAAESTLIVSTLLIYIFVSFIFTIPIYYLTRTKIKEQFK